MQYLSTRDSALRVSAQEAIVRGLAPQSGLFVPETFPQADLDAWKNLSYPELAEKVLAGFLTDYSADFLHTATASTYGAAFGGKAGETVKVDGKGLVLVVAKNVKITGAEEYDLQGVCE